MGINELMHECQLKAVNIYSGSFWLFECEGSEGTKSVFANEWTEVVQQSIHVQPIRTYAPLLHSQT